MQRHGVRRFVFSSSATVYGNPERLPIREDRWTVHDAASEHTLVVLEGVDLGGDTCDNAELSPEARAVVQKQYEGVLRNHDQMRALRDRYRNSTH